MRERLALAVLALTLALLVGLSAVFAWRHNRSEFTPNHTPATAVANTDTPPPAPLATSSAEKNPEATLSLTKRGAHVFAEQRCAACHAVAGAGNPRFPLDGIGGRLDEAALLDGIVGTGEVGNRLSPVVIRRKERYRALPEEDLAALVGYLGQLR